MYALLLGVIFLIVGYYLSGILYEDFANYKSEDAYTKQVKLLNDTYEPYKTGKAPVHDILTQNDLEDSETCFVNFYGLGVRFPSYLGPSINGYIDADIGVQTAVNAGCRVFVLDIDYIDDCGTFFPTLAVADKQGKNVINPASQPSCPSESKSPLYDVCSKINFYAFADSSGQREDPLIIVLYFKRHPPGSYQSKAVLDYFSNVAKALAPFRDRLLDNELDGGTFYRQKQEGRLLINNITDYNGKVLVFSNANTSGFRQSQAYSLDEDLDYMTHLRLHSGMSTMGITEKESNGMFGALQPPEDFLQLSPVQAQTMAEQTKLRWTICLSEEPLATVPEKTCLAVMNTKGVADVPAVNCVPAILFDPSSTYLFSDVLFKKYGFLPKPKAVRYQKPPIVTPSKPSKTTDAKGGALQAPTFL